jgi:hypothetical protein
MAARKKFILWAVAFLAAFLAGFLPRYVEVRQLRRDLAAAHEQAGFVALRDLLAQAYLEVTQNNFGTAGRYTTQFFDQAQELARTLGDRDRKRLLEELLPARDAVTAGLAKADPAVVATLQDLLRRLYAVPAR